MRETYPNKCLIKLRNDKNQTVMHKVWEMDMSLDLILNPNNFVKYYKILRNEYPDVEEVRFVIWNPPRFGKKGRGPIRWENYIRLINGVDIPNFE